MSNGQFKFWKLLLDIAIITAWVLGTDYIAETLINTQASTVLCVLALLGEIVFTYFLFKFFKPINQ